MTTIGPPIDSLRFLAPSASADVYRDRAQYRGAIRAIRNGDSKTFRKALNELVDYPLHDYLRYYDAESRLSVLSADEMSELRADLADLPAVERLYRSWLSRLARRGRWDDYLANYEPTSDPGGQCNFLRALYRSGDRTAALEQVRPIWIAPESLPKTCDPLFEVWIAADYLDDAAVWQRIELALAENEVSLARYLTRFLDDASSGVQFVDTHVRPHAVRQPDRFPATERGLRVLGHGYLRLARRDADEALRLFRANAERFAADEGLKRYVEEELLAQAVNEGIPVDRGPIGFGPNAIESIALGLVKQQSWDDAIVWISALPDALRNKVQWRYWLGRAHVASGDNPEAGRAHLEEIAGQRTYYAFLAAHRLGIEPSMNEQKPRNNFRAQRALLLGNRAVARLIELFAVDDLVNARREWYRLFPQLDREAQGHLIERLNAIGWQSQAIAGAFQADLRDLLEVRFPTPYSNLYRRYSFETDLALSFVYSITRQESAFDPRAISSAGARGLMQLMPATARGVANRIRAVRPEAEDLLDPIVNLRLGTHHLASLARRYDGHRALIAAAYNAGQHRADRWRKDVAGIPTDVWIERIPFYETRNYVKNVLAFNLVYSYLLDQPIPMLAVNERTIP